MVSDIQWLNLCLCHLQGSQRKEMRRISSHWQGARQFGQVLAVSGLKTLAITADSDKITSIPRLFSEHTLKMKTNMRL